MAEPQQDSNEHLESALLQLSNELKLSAKFLICVLSLPQLKSIAKSSGFNKPGVVKPEFKVAHAIRVSAKTRRAVAAQCLTNREHINHPKLVDALDQFCSGDSEKRSAAISSLSEIIESASQFTSPSPATSTAPKKSAAKATKPSEKQRLQSKLKDVKSQLADCRQQLSSAEQQIHAEHLRKTELKEDLAKANAENSRLRRRASELKKNLSSSTEASHREQQLQSLLDECHESLHLAQQKVEWLNNEREDLRSVLEDRDKFDSIQEDDVPNFNERPLLSIERDLKDQISAANSNFNILIVGGGEPQIKHRPKLEGYSEAVGFSATWRQAEYVSWHKEIDKLRFDMSTTFDALVILHWNRTTFTRKAREACNDAGQKPCITCHYQGFTNLRETLQECLRQLLCRQ